MFSKFQQFGLKIPVLRLRRIRPPEASKILSLGTIIKSFGEFALELLLFGFILLWYTL